MKSLYWVYYGNARGGRFLTGEVTADAEKALQFVAQRNARAEAAGGVPMYGVFDDGGSAQRVRDFR